MYIHCNFCLNLHITHGDMEENVSGCFFWTQCMTFKREAKIEQYWGRTDGVTECPIGCEICVETTKTGTTDYKTRCDKCRRGWKLLKTEGTCVGQREHCEFQRKSSAVYLGTLGDAPFRVWKTHILKYKIVQALENVITDHHVHSSAAPLFVIP